jgi:hypothetical protein
LGDACNKSIATQNVKDHQWLGITAAVRKTVKKSASSPRPGQSHALCLTVTAASSPLCFVREFTCAGEEPDLDFADCNVDTGGFDKHVTPGVVALEPSEKGKHACLIALIHRNLHCGGR